MLRKFCDHCNTEMDLNTGYEVTLRGTSAKLHMCNWECIRKALPTATAGDVESVKNLSPGITRTRVNWETGRTETLKENPITPQNLSTEIRKTVRTQFGGDVNKALGGE